MRNGKEMEIQNDGTTIFYHTVLFFMVFNYIAHFYFDFVPHTKLSFGVINRTIISYFSAIIHRLYCHNH